jgi:hypothetical protein
MKFASNIIVAAVLVLASAPAFAHGGGMGMGGMGMGGMGGTGGMGHSNGMTVNTQTQTHDWHNVTNINKNTTKTFFLKRFAVVKIQQDINRIDREIVRLVDMGKGNTKLVQKLWAQRAHLINERKHVL